MPGIDAGLDQDGAYSDPEVGVPPPPMIDHARKGRRAFDEGEVTAGSGSHPSASGTGSRPAASQSPQRFSLDGDDLDAGDGAAGEAYAPAPGPLPRIPSNAGFGGGAPGETFELRIDDEGSGLGDTGPGRTTGAGARRGGEVSGPGLDDLRELVGEHLPELVHRAVTEYCQQHFKALAREIIAAELRRLADERARHLVDN
jgi:hypothetical protein